MSEWIHRISFLALEKGQYSLCVPRMTCIPCCSIMEQIFVIL